MKNILKENFESKSILGNILLSMGYKAMKDMCVYEHTTRNYSTTL